VLFYGNHGLHRLVTHTPRQSLADFTDEHLLHLWLTLEYIRLSEAKATQRTVDFYKLNDVWATVLHSRTPALTTAVDITNYIKSSIVQYNPQFSYDDAVLTIIAEAVVTLFKQSAVVEPKSPQSTTSWTPRRLSASDQYINVDRTYIEEDYLEARNSSYAPERREPRYDTDDYWGMTAEENALIEQEYQDAMEREGIAQDRMEFDELERQTRYNDTDSWQNPHGYRD
jgi:hypothetical protein